MKNRVFLAFTVFVLISGISFADSAPYKEGELLVRFAGAGYGLDSLDPGVQAAARQQILDSAGGGTVVHLYKKISGWALVKLPAGQCVESMLVQYASAPGILSVEPDYKYQLHRMPNDARFNELWGMRNIGQAGGTPGADIDAPGAWDIETGDDQIIVAVTDSGIDYTHGDLAGNMWINTVEFNGDPDVDDDQNGYVDDIYGYDFVGSDIENPVGDSDPMDYDSHGTHVAGTIGAVGNNNIGVAGVCWNVRLMAVKICDDNWNVPDTYASIVAEAIEYIIDSGANIINASWGGGPYSIIIRDAIADARNAGILFVASAGNGGDDQIGDNTDLMPAYPASYDLDNIISVMSTNHNDNRPIYSNYGLNSVDIGAPGGDENFGPRGILSCIPGNQYEYYQGTSMAAPHVAGACALLLSFDPALSYTEVKNLLMDTADPAAALSGRCVSGGRLNLGAAIMELAADDDPPTPDPAQWASWGQPKATGLHTIAMEAKKAEDKGSVEYHFECVTNSNFNSGWQSGTFYAATGLSPGTYTFRVRDRDDSNNMTGWSVQRSATIGSAAIDPCSPFPDPPQWRVDPYAFRLTPVWIIMEARAASDESGVEYRFEGFEGSSLIYNSDWRDSASLNILGGPFTIGNVYEFKFRVRDKSANQNVSAYSSTKSMALRQGPRTLPVPSHYPTIQSAIDAANPGDVVVVSSGVYIANPGDVNLIMKPGITVTSTDPNNPSIVASTIIDCRGLTRGFNFISGEEPNSVVTGLTIRNGVSQGAVGTPGDPGQTGDPNDPNNPHIDPTPAGAGGDGMGGGMIFIGSSPTILNCVLDGCSAEGGDGGDPNGATGNAAGSGYGGGIYCDAMSNPIIRGCEIMACSTSSGFATDNITFGMSFGGGIYIDHGSGAIIQGCTISGCTASGTYGGTGNGGGIYHALAGSPVSIIDTRVIGSNIASDRGGGIFFAPGGSGAILTNCEIAFNTSFGNGGGIYYPDGHTLSIEDGSRIYRNTCLNKGGGIFAGDIAHAGATTVSISDSLVNDNSAVFGGGIYMDETRLSMVNSDLSRNSAEQGAGIDGAYCDVNIVGSTISENEAVTGAGIGGGILLWNSTGRIINSVIQNNIAEGAAGFAAGLGGAMYFNGFDVSPKQLVNCLISGNEASREGAGLFCHLGAWAEVTNCTIADNSVTGGSGSGGGITCAESSAIVQLKNSIVYNNSAPDGSQIAAGRVTGSIIEPHAAVIVDYSDVQGGEDGVFEELPNAFVMFDTGNWDEDNPFVSTGGEELTYFLRHVATGQATTSNLVDNGMGNASDLGPDLTTRIDGVEDTGTVDIGYHYPAMAAPEQYYQLTIRVDGHPDYDADGVLKAQGVGFEPFFARNEPNTMLIRQGVEVRLTAIADDGFNVFQWTGADQVLNTGDPCNIVTMNADKEVAVSFEPDGAFYLYTEVSTNNGRIDYINSSSQRVEHPGRTLHEAGEVVQLFAVPNNPLHIPHWSGTDDDETVDLENTVTMNETRNVAVEFLTPRTLNVPGEYTNIQTAIDDAEDGDIIIIAPGSYMLDDAYYYPPINKQITISSSDPQDPCVVANTIIRNALQIVDVGRTCVIDGLTFDNWHIFGRGGFDGGTEINPLADGSNGIPVTGGAITLHEFNFDITAYDEANPPVGSSPDIRNCVFRNRSVEGGDGGAGAVVNDAPGDGGWGAWAHGGAVSIGASSSPRFTNCTFIDCYAQGGDGGNGSDGGRGGLWTQTDLGTGGWMFGPYAEYFKYTGLGGAVYVGKNSSPEFIDCNFINCRAYGGASGTGGGGVNPDVHWRINRFGGAVYCADDSTATFTQCNFINNTADVNGPAQWDWASFQSTGTAEAENANEFLSYGGAVAFEDSANVTFIQCDFNYNIATVGGAVHWTWADPVFDDCNFAGNTAYHGGGIVCVGGSGLINNCRFTGNSATFFQGQGGAIACLGANTDILNSEIIGNQAQGSGGGLYISSKDVRGNEVTSWPEISVRNCLIAENTAGSTGAGISSNWHSFADIELCTIANNSVLQGGYGGGLYSSNGNYTIVRDSIIWGNAAANGRQIAIRPSTNPAGVAISYTNVRGGNTYTQPPATGGSIWVDENCLFAPGPGNIGADLGDNPLFVSGILGDYYLSQVATAGQGQTQDSPSVNAGSSSASSRGMDIRTTRTDEIFDQGKVDMGYHYPLSSLAAQCKFCDIVRDGRINFADFSEFIGQWLGTDCSEGNGWCGGADFNFDNEVDLGDYAVIARCWMMMDNDPPMPDPMQWQISPHSTSSSAISMGAKLAYDDWGGQVEYFFERSDANHNLDWQIDPNYDDSGLIAGRQYSYRVKARDEWGNETQFSGFGTAVVNEDSTAPTPDPMTWAVLPVAVSNTAITMTASTANDASGVEYGFRRVGVPDVWQDEPNYVEEGLEPSTEYTYQTAARDKSDNQNTTAWSVPASAITTDTPTTADLEPPITGVHTNIYKAAFAVIPAEVWVSGSGYYHQMTAVTATDDTPPVQYKFYCLDDSRFNSGWQEDPFYDVLVSSLQSKSSWRWQVRTRDSVTPVPNLGDLSDVYNCRGESE